MMNATPFLQCKKVYSKQPAAPDALPAVMLDLWHGYCVDEITVI